MSKTWLGCWATVLASLGGFRADSCLLGAACSLPGDVAGLHARHSFRPSKQCQVQPKPEGQSCGYVIPSQLSESQTPAESSLIPNLVGKCFHSEPCLQACQAQRMSIVCSSHSKHYSKQTETNAICKSMKPTKTIEQPATHSSSIKPTGGTGWAQAHGLQQPGMHTGMDGNVLLHASCSRDNVGCKQSAGTVAGCHVLPAPARARDWGSGQGTHLGSPRLSRIEFP